MKLFSREEILTKMKMEIAKSLKHSYIVVETRKDSIVLGFDGEGQQVYIHYGDDIGIYAYVWIKTVGEGGVSARVSLDQLDILLENNMLCEHG